MISSKKYQKRLKNKQLKKTRKSNIKPRMYLRKLRKKLRRSHQIKTQEKRRKVPGETEVWKKEEEVNGTALGLMIARTLITHTGLVTIVTHTLRRLPIDAGGTHATLHRILKRLMSQCQCLCPHRRWHQCQCLCPHSRWHQWCWHQWFRQWYWSPQFNHFHW